MSRKIALRSLKNLCTFIGAIALFSYFANWAVDLRHWYFTLASAVVCAILWLGFYVIELRGGVTQVILEISHLRTKAAELPLPTSEPLISSANPPPAYSHAEEPQEAAPPNPLPWLNPRRQATSAEPK